MDRDGYLFVEGRLDDTIIRGAENIAPAEIEDVLLRYPEVSDAVVVGVPDEEWGQRVEAAVVARPGSSITSEQLREYVRSQLRSSKTPDRVVFWDELPRNATGKMLRRDVVAALVNPQVACDLSRIRSG
jgi:acyl-CoA synthetase (AMP-forming)/AMP-acid ligase II